MSTPEERAENNKKVDDIIAKACNGDKFAAKYLADIAWCCRRIDDLYDGDYAVPSNDIEILFRKFFVDIPMNPFYLKNYQTLTCQQAIFYNAWMDSNRWAEETDKTKRLYAHVIRDYIDETVRMVAFIIGGFDKLREISLVSRETFMKEFQ